MLNQAASLPCNCFLLRRVSRKVTRAYDRAVAPAGLTITQLALLRNAQRNPGASVAVLARDMGMDRTTLLRTLRPAVDAGWIRYGERMTGRSAELELTAKGRARLRIATPMWIRAQAALRARLGPARASRLTAILQSTLAAL